MISASIAANSSLLIEPSRQLTFALDARTVYTDGISQELRLMNISEEKRVFFKVRTTNTDMFTVKPVNGVIERGATLNARITLVPSACAQLASMNAADRRARIERFMVQSADELEDLQGLQIDAFGEMWKRIPLDFIHGCRLTCRFVRVDADDAPLANSVMPSRPVVPTLTLDGLDTSRQGTESDRPARGLPTTHTTPSTEALAVSSDKPPSDISVDTRRNELVSMHVLSHSAISSTPPQAVQPTIRESFAQTNSTAFATAISLPAEKRAFEIVPSDCIEFVVNDLRAKRVVSEFSIVNHSSEDGLAFKVKTTNHSRYYVKPCRGWIRAQSTRIVQVALAKPESALHEAEVRDKFMVEILDVDSITEDRLERMPEDQVKDEVALLWKQPHVHVDKMILCCKVTSAPSPPSDSLACCSNEARTRTSDLATPSQAPPSSSSPRDVAMSVHIDDEKMYYV